MWRIGCIENGCDFHYSTALMSFLWFIYKLLKLWFLIFFSKRLLFGVNNIILSPIIKYHVKIIIEKKMFWKVGFLSKS